ncbi:MAG TPA: hypothetical protein VMS22_05830 [Candidatus Eisenbacteria bacterium]|nr:hypothetical protein [Candidatus Eisenbacteria bacterium]
MTQTLLRVLAILIAVRGIGNLLKRFGTGSGLVVFGRLLPRETLLAPLLGLVMLAYAYGLWTRRAWALPLGVAYALFATANLALFPVVTGLPPGITMPMYAVYVVAGIAMSWGAVVLLQAARTSR